MTLPTRGILNCVQYDSIDASIEICIDFYKTRKCLVTEYKYEYEYCGNTPV